MHGVVDQHMIQDRSNIIVIGLRAGQGNAEMRYGKYSVVVVVVVAQKRGIKAVIVANSPRQ